MTGLLGLSLLRAFKHGHACVKGKFGLEYINNIDRLSTPLVRKNGNVRKSLLGGGS